MSESNEMELNSQMMTATVLHWNYRGFTEFPIQQLKGEESDITDIYLKENLISRLPNEIGRLENLESLYLSGNDITELPREISRLRCLKCLDISGNRLKYIPDEIGEVRALKFLILDENELSELPLRLGELRALRYLSVCDNKLRWLPQRPVHNYYHSEFRFWRNPELRTIPYSLWYHMLRDQQTRSLNIGCLQIPKYENIRRQNRCRLKFKQDAREWEIDVDCPSQFNNVLQSNHNSPPSLGEMCKRKIYSLISYATKKLNEDISGIMYKDSYDPENNNYLGSSEDDANGIRINTDCDLNGNNCSLNLIPSVFKRGRNNGSEKKEGKRYYVAADILKEFLSFLPKVITQQLSNGPVSHCENADCKKPIFDYVHYEFCIGRMTLIDRREDIILNVTFCSKLCADTWKRGNSVTIPWILTKL